MTHSDIEELVEEWMTETLASFDPGYPGRAKFEEAAFKESEIAREIRIKEIMEEEMEEELAEIMEEMQREEAEAEEKAEAKAKAEEV
jgi:deoxycytidine triphosphate deaminase